MRSHRAALVAAAIPFGVSGVSAADLPVVVEPVDYVRICDAFGSGFFYIPGTETCIRVSGRIRTDFNVFLDTDDDDGFDVLGGGGYEEDGEDGYRIRARAYIYTESRTNTEYGLLRTLTELRFTQDNDALVTQLERGFIQFGGLTFGRTQSFYDFVDAIFTPKQFFDPSVSDQDQNLVAYTVSFGNGFSASIALEDETPRRSGFAFMDADGDSNIDDVTYEGTRIPDIVASIRVEQGWGTAQVMAAGHYSEVYGDVPATAGLGDEAYGFALGGGVVVDLPFGNGTEAGLTATYAHGAVDYASTEVEAPFDALDGVVSSDGDLELSDAFSVSGGIGTDLTPTVSLALQAGYLYVDNDDVDIDGDGVDEAFSFSNLDLQAFVAYEPVSGFVLGLGAEYRYVDTKDFGQASGVTGYFRAQRTY